MSGNLSNLLNECANLTARGTCLGVDIRLAPDGAFRHTASPTGKCRVRESKRCSYFERCVLTLAASRPEYVGAESEYRGRCGLSMEKVKAARACGDCGDPRPKGKRYCTACAAKHKRMASRRASARQRQRQVAE